MEILFSSIDAVWKERDNEVRQGDLPFLSHILQSSNVSFTPRGNPNCLLQSKAYFLGQRFDHYSSREALPLYLAALMRMLYPAGISSFGSSEYLTLPALIPGLILNAFVAREFVVSALKLLYSSIVDLPFAALCREPLDKGILHTTTPCLEKLLRRRTHFVGICLKFEV
ncbi:hypothetical protein POTOM_001217 [Populus tomentosa]|uniref:Uncharacterized protein n=1 Tax=Populus tomentosa TaxID=118781 RepID=A0A8X8DHG9_POPTO|nr:hypothetical protein POTOM_001217 [Populus tomentosa]